MNNMEEKEKKQLKAAVENMKNHKYADTVGILESLAEKGDPIALYWLGIRCLHTMRVPNDPLESKRHFRVIWRDEKKAIAYISKSAEKGFPRALYWMGKEHHLGRRLCMDDAKAVKFFQQAANQGYIPAIYQLSECYLFAWGIPRNNDEASRLCRKAAEAGYPPAEYRMAYYCGGNTMTQEQSGSGSTKPEKLKRAMCWMRKAAEHGHMVAQYKMGRYCLKVADDKEQAIWWLHEAANKGLLNAQRLLEEIDEKEASA